MTHLTFHIDIPGRDRPGALDRRDELIAALRLAGVRLSMLAGFEVYLAYGDAPTVGDAVTQAQAPVSLIPAGEYRITLSAAGERSGLEAPGAELHQTLVSLLSLAGLDTLAPGDGYKVERLPEGTDR